MSESAHASRIWQRAHPLRALAEGWLVGGGLYHGVMAIKDLPTQLVPMNAFYLTGLTALWIALRMRPHRSARCWAVWRDHALWAMLLSLAVFIGWGWGVIIHPATHIALPQTESLLILLFLAAIGLEFLLFRLAFWGLRSWQQLCRHRFRWSIVNNQLRLALFLVLLVGAAASIPLIIHYGGVSAGEPEGWFPGLVTRFLWTSLPWLLILAGTISTALLILLPPAALVSNRLARRTTRRIEALANATEALQQGQYSARLTVEGQDEIAHLQEQFNHMADELESALARLATERDRVSQLLASRRQLVAQVSHELRTPVATLRATIESRLDTADELAPDVLHDLDVLHSEVLHLQHLIDDLFALSRAEAGGLQLDIGPVDLVSLIRARIDAMAPLAWERAKVELIASFDALDEATLTARADVTRVDQVLINLIDNAVRHTPPGGIVAVTAQAMADGMVQIAVRDTGEGIAAEELPHIWDRFYRGQAQQGTSANDAQSAGLGLCLVKELAEAMGGTVSVESRLGEGSCFCVTLPAHLPS